MVKIRLARRGRKKYPLYDIVAADIRAPRDGRFIEKLGNYNPNTVPATIVLDDDKAVKWLLNGAKPTDTVRAILSYRGVMLRKHLQVGVLKGAITQEQADAKFQEWKDAKESKIGERVEKLSQEKADKAKEKLEAEKKVKEARSEALRKKLEDAAKEAAAEANTEEEAESTEEATSEEGAE